MESARRKKMKEKKESFNITPTAYESPERCRGQAPPTLIGSKGGESFIGVSQKGRGEKSDSLSPFGDRAEKGAYILRS